MPIPDEAAPSTPPTRVSITSVTLDDRGVVITGTLPPELAAYARAAAGFSALRDKPQPCSCVEDYVCPLHGTGVLEQDHRPDWGEVAAWERHRDTELLARTLEDLAGLDPTEALALAAVLRPAEGPHVEVQAAVVSRTDLRRLADLSQTAGPEHDHAWVAYKAAGAEDLTAWRAFVAGIRTAAEYRRG